MLLFFLSSSITATESAFNNMKLSLKLHDDQPTTTTTNPQLKKNPILKAKVPITILNQPLISSITTTTRSAADTTTASPTDLSFSFSTNFSSGPSFKFSYTPTASAASSPFSVSLKSGLGLFGSPRHSPLVFSANLSLSPSNPNPIPTFSLHFKPQLGDFSLRKTVVSNPATDPKSGPLSGGGAFSDSGSASDGEFVNGFVTDSPSSVWQEVKLDPKLKSVHSKTLSWRDGGRGGLLSGVAVSARTALPVTKGLVVNLRWGVNLPADLGMKMPYLTVSKIGIERVEEVKEVKKKNVECNMGELDLLKGLCFWMKRDLETLEKENREMKHCLEEMRLGALSRSHRKNDDGARKTTVLASPIESSNDRFEQWRSKKSAAEENTRREVKKPVNKASDLEDELQRAIKAASS